MRKRTEDYLREIKEVTKKYERPSGAFDIRWFGRVILGVDLDPEIFKAASDASAMACKALAMNEAVKDARELVANSPDTFTAPLCESPCRVRGRYGSFIHGVELSAYNPTEENVAAITRFLRKRGYDNPNIKEWPEYQQRDYDFNGEIFITFNFKTSGDEESSCKYVQVGTETKEEPIYELQCGDQPKEATV